MANDCRRTALGSGELQGVGFRSFFRRLAEPRGLRGRASNLPDGRVEVVAEGERGAAQDLLDALRGAQTPGTVRDVDAQWAEPAGLADGFSAQ